MEARPCNLHKFSHPYFSTGILTFKGAIIQNAPRPDLFGAKAGLTAFERGFTTNWLPTSQVICGALQAGKLAGSFVRVPVEIIAADRVRCGFDSFGQLQ